MRSVEVNFDGLVGPSHNYAGLSLGNVASAKNAQQTANPKAAALQGLDKMEALMNLGLVQGFIPPLKRPNLHLLECAGFSGSTADMLAAAAHSAPKLLQACYSASSMWTANAATVSPSADTADGKVHFTPANLINKLHRSIEHTETGAWLRKIFSDPRFFMHHQALPGHDLFGDEGAANHTRLCGDYAAKGIELFIYGADPLNKEAPQPTRYPARQTRLAAEAVVRLHKLDESSCVLAQQSPEVIDQGVFHNDVIAVGNRNVLFYHQSAFLDAASIKAAIIQRWPSNEPFYFIEVPAAEVSVDDAVRSYLFNTQLVNLPSGEMVIIAPTECRDTPAVAAYLNRLIAQDNPIHQVIYLDLRQSMQNGGGPACLRLRVALTQPELAAVDSRFILDNAKLAKLRALVNTHYPEQVQETDLARIEHFEQVTAATTALYGLIESF